MSEVQSNHDSLELEMFGDKEVRWYQTAALHAVEQALEDGRMRILIEMPTGTGKTVTSGLIFSSDRVRQALKVPAGEPLRLLFVAHKHRLLTQAEREYASAMNVEFIPQSAFSQVPAEVLEAGWHITCIDEAHHEAMMSIQYQLELIGDKPIVGMTATPDRADGMLIKFETIINPISREDAVEQGFLAPTYLHSFVDTSAKDKTPVLKDILSKFGHEMGQTMIFVKTRREVSIIVNHLGQLGYSARGILNQSERELNSMLDAFSAGTFQFIVNCNKINEGVDVKRCTDVVLGRQFGSYPQLNQVIGRASRPDSDCNVWELINPLSGRNLDTTVVVGTPERHRLLHVAGGEWQELEFSYHTIKPVMQSGIKPAYAMYGPQ